jgi:hypothetical protein
MPRTGKWNGKSATVLRRDGDAYVIQVREVEAMGRGHAFERILHVTAQQWNAANPSRTEKDK